MTPLHSRISTVFKNSSGSAIAIIEVLRSNYKQRQMEVDSVSLSAQHGQAIKFIRDCIRFYESEVGETFIDLSKIKPVKEPVALPPVIFEEEKIPKLTKTKILNPKQRFINKQNPRDIFGTGLVPRPEQGFGFLYVDELPPWQSRGIEEDKNIKKMVILQKTVIVYEEYLKWYKKL